jgi:hypothetical protein
MGINYPDTKKKELTMRKRSLLFSIIVAVSLFAFALAISPEAKAAYPDKPIRMIVPFPAGATRTLLPARSATN